MSDERRSCLTDIPIGLPDEDELNSRQYARAIGNFIRNADTPITLGIQGGWGSGKTSMLSLLRNMLEEPNDSEKQGEKTSAEINEHEENPTCCITINAWEHSLFQNEDNRASVVLSILSDLVGKVGEWKDLLDPEGKKKLKWTTIASIISTMRKAMPDIINAGMQFVVPGASFLQRNGGNASQDNMVVPALADQIHELKKNLGEFINHLKYKNGRPIKVVIFIDDLDRVPPPTAVEILDVTKNIFDIKNCIFVIAIDYEVIVKGLEKKFGPRNKNNEREFRQYFDKIIQIPFTMPIGAFSRQIEIMLRNALFRLDYKFEETAEREILRNLARACKLATGGLPRSLKRIVNTFSLLDYIANERRGDTDQADKKMNLEARFMIVALHINFPEIFRCIMERPDFTQWKLEELEIPWELDYAENEKQLKSLACSRVQKYFDEDWEKVVFCLCTKSEWLKHNAINVSCLLNLLRDVLVQVPDDEENEAGKPRELSDASVEILRQLIESIRVIAIDNELQTGEIGGNAAQERIFTEFARRLAEKIQARLPEVVFDEDLTKVRASVDDENAWLWVCRAGSEVQNFECYWHTGTNELWASWWGTRFGMKKDDMVDLMKNVIRDSFEYGTQGGGKNGRFWVGYGGKAPSQSGLLMEETLDEYAEHAVAAYKETKRIIGKIKRLKEE